MILVTGGTGLVGTHLLFHLLKKGFSVRAIYRAGSKLEKVEEIFSFYHSHPKEYFDKIEWVEADINDIPSLELAFIGITKVYHCAAYISFDPGDFKQLQKVNEEGTINIVNLCIAKKIQKLCYVSSIAGIGSSMDRAYLMQQFAENLAAMLEEVEEEGTEALAGAAEETSATAAERGEPRRVEMPEPEAIDLMEAAGQPIMKRVVPLVIVVVALLVLRRILRSKRS